MVGHLREADPFYAEGSLPACSDCGGTGGRQRYEGRCARCADLKDQGRGSMVDFGKLERKRKEREANPGPLVFIENAKTPLSKWRCSTWHYVGRPVPRSPIYRGSSLANPFRIGADGDRDEVVRRYRSWLWEQMRDPASEQSRELQQVLEYSLAASGITLVCWCAPQACHADVVKAAVEWLYKQGQDSTQGDNNGR